jgi:LmbE family N-acetylglucosaminyl deacetylase
MISSSLYERFARTLVIVVSPHPDDSVLGAGGLIYRLTDTADWAQHTDLEENALPAVYTFVMTSGSRGLDDEFLRRFAMTAIRETDPLLADYIIRKGSSGEVQPELEKRLALIRADIRRQESQAEARILRVKESYFLDLKGVYYDHTISDADRAAVRNQLATLRDRHPGFSVLFLVAHRDDVHPVHKLSTELIVGIVENDLHWRDTAVWQYESPWITFTPHQIECVVPFGSIGMATKAEAMSVHRSQEYRTRYSDVARYSAQMRAETFPELLGGFGQSAHHWDYIEAFQELRPVTVLEMTAS